MLTYLAAILFSYHQSADKRTTGRNMLGNTLYIKIHNQIKFNFSVVYTFEKKHNVFCFCNTNCNARINDMFFTTVPGVLRVR